MDGLGFVNGMKDSGRIADLDVSESVAADVVVVAAAAVAVTEMMHHAVAAVVEATVLPMTNYCARLVRFSLF